MNFSMYRWSEWGMDEPKWLRRLKAERYEAIIREVYLKAFHRELMGSPGIAR